jgi:hypothetical protein
LKQYSLTGDEDSFVVDLQLEARLEDSPSQANGQQQLDQQRTAADEAAHPAAQIRYKSLILRQNAAKT